MVTNTETDYSPKRNIERDPNENDMSFVGLESFITTLHACL